MAQHVIVAVTPNTAWLEVQPLPAESANAALLAEPKYDELSRAPSSQGSRRARRRPPTPDPSRTRRRCPGTCRREARRRPQASPHDRAREHATEAEDLRETHGAR